MKLSEELQALHDRITATIREGDEWFGMDDSKQSSGGCLSSSNSFSQGMANCSQQQLAGYASQQSNCGQYSNSMGFSCGLYSLYGSQQ